MINPYHLVNSVINRKHISSVRLKLHPHAVAAVTAQTIKYECYKSQS